jgi:hypothetical protein
MTAMGNLFFSIMSTSLAMLTITSSINTILFLNKSDGMAADIGSLVEKLNVHVV